MADGELLQVYFERHLEPRDLDHELPASAATAGMNYPDSMPGAGYSLVPDGWRREGEFFVNPEIVVRIAHVREELRRRCAAGELVLRGCIVHPGGLGMPQAIVLPLPDEWRFVEFLPKISRVRYASLEFVAVEVCALAVAGEVPTEVEVREPCAVETALKGYGAVQIRLRAAHLKLVKKLEEIEAKYRKTGKLRGLKTEQAALLMNETRCSKTSAMTFLDNPEKD
jgi:hypothetical protein